MLFDTHSHIQFKSFDKNRKNVIERAKKAGVKKIIAIGTDLESSKKAAEIFYDLKSKGEIIDIADILIASIVLANNELFITGNSKHFERIEELKIENVY